MINKNIKISIKNILQRFRLLNVWYYLKYPFHFYPSIKGDQKDIIVCGMMRSGSTLVFNIVKDILSYNDNEVAHCKNEKIYRHFINEEKKIIKIHKRLPLIIKRIKNGSSIGIFTYRDLRDIAVSMIQKGWKDFDDIIGTTILENITINSIEYARTPNINLICYEKYINNIEKLIIQLCKIVNKDISKEKMSSLVKKYQIEQVKSSIGDLEFDSLGFDKYDSQTGFHEHHISDGLSDKWKDFFNENEKKQLFKRTKKFSDYFNYGN